MNRFNEFLIENIHSGRIGEIIDLSEKFFKEALNKSSAHIAQSDFSRDCIK